MMTAPCKIEGCNRPPIGRGMCKLHYQRWRRYGDPNGQTMTPRGEPMRWLRAHTDYNEDACLDWPFSRRPNGYAQISGGLASRIMCRLAHGDPPSPAHQAAHSCGRGQDGCINPRHLRWATQTENEADKLIHGTLIFGETHPISKLNVEAVKTIRKIASTRTQRAIAEQFGVTQSTISAVLSHRTWGHIP